MARLENLLGAAALTVTDLRPLSARRGALLTLLTHPGRPVAWLGDVLALTSSGATRLVSRLVKLPGVGQQHSRRRRPQPDPAPHRRRARGGGQGGVRAQRRAHAGGRAPQRLGARRPGAPARPAHRRTHRRARSRAADLPPVRRGACAGGGWPPVRSHTVPEVGTARDRDRDAARPRAAPGRRSPGVSMIAMTFGLARYGYGLLLPEMRADLHMSAEPRAWCCRRVPQLPAGDGGRGRWWSTRWGPRAAIVAAALLQRPA